MNIKRAIGLSILAYIATFVVGALVAVVSGVDLGEIQEAPTILWVTGALVSVAFAWAFAWWYFRSPKTIASPRNGLLFGLVMIATGFILDFVTFLPLVTREDPWGSILAYYFNPFFWGTVVLVVITTTLVGKCREREGR